MHMTSSMALCIYVPDHTGLPDGMYRYLLTKTNNFLYLGRLVKNCGKYIL
jgi:hypothetical protein